DRAAAHRPAGGGRRTDRTRIRSRGGRGRHPLRSRGAPPAAGRTRPERLAGDPGRRRTRRLRHRVGKAGVHPARPGRTTGPHPHRTGPPDLARRPGGPGRRGGGPGAARRQDGGGPAGAGGPAGPAAPTAARPRRRGDPSCGPRPPRSAARPTARRTVQVRLLVENRFALLFLVVVALAALFGAARLSAAALPAPGEDAEEVLAPVESTTRVCPTPQGEDRRTLVAGYAPDQEGGTADGLLDVAPNLADAEGDRPAPEAGQPWRHEPEETDSGTVVRAEGAFAAGAEISQTTAGDATVTEVRCADPSSSTWFAAPGGTELEDLRLHPANIDETPATVNVDLYAPDGPAFSLETRGVTVEGRTEVELSVLPLVEHAEAVVVHV